VTPEISWVECIGTFSIVTYWRLVDGGMRNGLRLGRRREPILGNDAFIVAGHLNAGGMRATCRLLDPTGADMKRAASVLGKDNVVSTGVRQGRRSHSLCIEEADGVRTWVVSRIPEPQDNLGDTSADLVYADFYPELSLYFNHELPRLGRVPAFINLSSLLRAKTIPSLAINPLVVQASAGSATSIGEATDLALRIGDKTKAKKVFVTQGAGGAVLATGECSWHSMVKGGSAARIMGAGARFSAEVIMGLARGLDREALLQWAVEMTSLKLRTMVAR
jgi:hypothetical protein